jgi:rhodanese-related sulfurtransferase
MRQIQPPELAAWLADASRPRPQLLDVREGWEFEIARIEGSVHVPMNALPARLDELDPARPVVCVCHHGGRSAQVGYWLERNGFGDVINLRGGVDAWAREVAPDCPRY